MPVESPPGQQKPFSRDKSCCAPSTEPQVLIPHPKVHGDKACQNYQEHLPIPVKSSSPIDPPALGRGVWGWLRGEVVIPEAPISTSRENCGVGEEIQQGMGSRGTGGHTEHSALFLPHPNGSSIWRIHFILNKHSITQLLFSI